MKKKIVYLSFIFLATSLTACGGSEDAESDSDNGSAPYYLKLGEDGVEGAKDDHCNYVGDGISNEAKFTLDGAALIIKEFVKDAEEGEVADLEGKTFDGSITINGKTVEGEVSITGTKKGRAVSFGNYYDLIGSFEGNGGEEGAFCLNYYLFEG